MILFATPDFGASAGIMLFVLGVWAVVLAMMAPGFVIGVRLARSDSARRAFVGYVLATACLLVPLSCCVGPPFVIRLVYGNFPLRSYPNGKIREGMSRDEVIAILGTPHEHYVRPEGSSWFYWLDSYGMGWFGVYFDPNGRVNGTSGN